MLKFRNVRIFESLILLDKEKMNVWSVLPNQLLFKYLLFCISGLGQLDRAVSLPPYTRVQVSFLVNYINLE